LGLDTLLYVIYNDYMARGELFDMPGHSLSDMTMTVLEKVMKCTERSARNISLENLTHTKQTTLVETG
jgi:hypothetical protein